MQAEYLPRCLLARYIPNPIRMEPRNIGVILWSPVGTASRFRSIPEFVDNKIEYLYFTDLFKIRLSMEKLPLPDGTCVNKADERFLDAFSEVEFNKYVFEKHAYLLERLDKKFDLHSAANYMFELLVL